MRTHLLTSKIRIAVAATSLIAIGSTPGAAEEPMVSLEHYQQEIQPFLETHCFACHANGSKEGGLAFDSMPTEDLLANRPLWWNVLKNVRAGLMPPKSEARPDAKELTDLSHWIHTSVFAIDPSNPDPGRITVRRLNRTEYRNTIRDLMGIDFNAEVVFPPEDTGFGFDTVGDVLSISPLMMEKYLRSARTIVDEAVPRISKETPRQNLGGRDFESESQDLNGSRITCDRSGKITKTIKVTDAGEYRLEVTIRSHGSFFFNPARCNVKMHADGMMLYEDEYGWDESKRDHYTFTQTWDAGTHHLTFDISALPIDQKALDDADDDTYAAISIEKVDLVGPINANKWVHPENYERFFTQDEPPESSEERRVYAAEILRAFASKAYRRPVDDATVERLVAFAEQTYQQPNKTFESGIAQAITAVLASPRFLFRIEEPSASDDSLYPLVDEFSLASRLSYFLWSTMPDQELLDLAAAGKLRANLHQQVDRMLANDRSDSFIESFVGQWLRSRDIEHISIDPAVVLGFGKEVEELRAAFRRRDPNSTVSDEERQRARERFREIRELTGKFDEEAREAMRRETEMMIEYIARENRSVLEIIDSNYVFVNEKLADLYDLPGVEGEEMRRVELPEGSPRGGLLTQGTMLVVTSNPGRTSPVKRGLYILENVLGLPSPVAPPNVPELEAAADRFGGREPSLRELLEVHREAPLCASCHARMDPLGLALENFNALGMWRDKIGEEAIEVSGEMATGEVFDNIRDLKKILIENHRQEFYRCLAQKLMIYALGRGVEYTDEATVESIVQQMEADGGHFKTLLMALVDSAAFQRQRRPVADSSDVASN